MSVVVLLGEHAKILLWLLVVTPATSGGLSTYVLLEGQKKGGLEPVAVCGLATTGTPSSGAG